MLTRRRTFTDRDDLDDLVQIDPDAESLDHRTRDLGIPDGVWWIAAGIGGFVAMMAVMGLLQPLGEVPAEAVGGGVGGAMWAFAVRRWGHRRFRLRAAIADGLWFGLLFAGFILVHGAAQRLFAMVTG